MVRISRPFSKRRRCRYPVGEPSEQTVGYADFRGFRGGIVAQRKIDTAESDYDHVGARPRTNLFGGAPRSAPALTN